jgi:site-specific DNA-methyltransferase (adenine-specific)
VSDAREQADPQGSGQGDLPQPALVVPAIRPYYQDASVTLFCGDCWDILPQLQADVVLTDVPYNARKNYGETTDDNMPWPEWCAWMDVTIGLCKAAAPNVFSFLSQTASKEYIRRGIYPPDWQMVWFKPLSMSICAAPFMPHWEPIFYWGAQKRTKDGGALWGGDVVTANVEVGTDRWGHPTPKPLRLMLDLVSRFHGVLLDPFAGSGTTLAAAKQLGRRAFGIEINEAYCDEIAARLADTAIGFKATAHQAGLFAGDTHVA